MGDSKHVDILDWHELDHEVRSVASEWADFGAETLRKFPDEQMAVQTTLDQIAAYEMIAAAAKESSEGFVKAWASVFGEPSHTMDLSPEFRDASMRCRVPRRLIESALRPAKAELVRGPKLLSDSKSLEDYQRSLSHLLSNYDDLVLDHAVYGLYVAWRRDTRIVLPDNRPQLLRAMAVDESLFRVVTPRQFEELIAYVYEQMGCRVELTQASRDFGADLLAWHYGPMSSESLIAVQVKRYAKKKKVGIKGLFELNGAVSHYNAQQGHIVTTSDFTKPAADFGDQQGFHLVNVADLQAELATLFE